VELIAVDQSKVISLFWAAVEPGAGQPFLPDVANALVDRYKFQGCPKTIEELKADHVSFSHGYFDGSMIENFDVYRDGVMVSSKCDTKILDDFIENIVEWMQKDIGLRPIKTHEINKIYESNLLIQSEKDILSPLNKLKKIQTAIQESVHSASGLDASFYPFGISLATDTASLPGLKPAPFRLERKLGLAFDMNYYVSEAPVPTSDHFSILQMLEDLA